MLLGGRVASLAFVALSAIVSGGSCTGSEDAQPMAASPGGKQVPGGGATLSEGVACMRLVVAEEKARHRLNCPELERAACPFYVRPAGTGCWTYDEASLSACEDTLAGYQFCSDFTQQRCVLTAVPADPGSCPALGSGGEGGQSGAAGGSGVSAGGQSGQSGRSSGGTSGRVGTGGSGAVSGRGGGGPGSGGTSGASGAPASGASGESGHAGAGG